jgi:hypothetical protein
VHTIAILIPCTRLDFLAKSLLPAIIGQLEASASDELEVQVFICLNGPASNLDYAEIGFADQVVVLTTPLSGFAIPRNILWDASRDYDHVIFIDDDQIPDHKWFETFVRAVELHSSFDVIFGGVNYIPTSELTQSQLALSPKARPKFNGEVTNPFWGGIGNTIICRNTRTNIESPFNEDFNWGGEDLAFFLLLRDRGCRFFSVPEASVNEFWETHRVTLRMVLKRMHRQIGSYYRIRLFQKANKGFYDRNWIKVYSRLPLLMIALPFYVAVLGVSFTVPNLFVRNSIQLKLGKVVLVSIAPWQSLFASKWKSV